MVASTIGAQRIEFLRRVHKDMIPVFTRSTVPVFEVLDGKAAPCGTCMLFKIADTPFAVSAAHVFDGRGKQLKNITYVVPAPDIARNYTHLEGKLLAAPEDKIDFSILALSPKSAIALRSMRFLTLDDIELRDGPLPHAHEWYYVFGYPQCRLNSGGAAEPFLAYGSVLYGGPTSNFENYDRSYHVLFEMYTKDNFTFEGKAADIPQLEGMSGSPIWWTQARPDNVGTWRPEMAKVVAVQTGFYCPKPYKRNGVSLEVLVLKGVRWSLIITALEKEFPGLRPALGLVRRP